MSLVLAFLMTSTLVLAAPASKSKILPVTKEEELVKREKIAKEKLKVLDAKVEDCDEKAKKPIEIKPEAISLTGNAGCSLDDAH
jgi:hypothetical protein